MPETQPLSKAYYAEYPQSPMRDTLFLSIVSKMEACEFENGWACFDCKAFGECDKLLSGLAGKSATYKLTNPEAMKYIERFNRIKKRAGKIKPLPSPSSPTLPTQPIPAPDKIARITTYPK